MKLAPTMFHFNCPFCGAHPAEVQLADFLERWRHSPQSDFDAVISVYADILRVVHGSPTGWRTKRFFAALAKVIDLVGCLREAPHPPTESAAHIDFRSVDCPLCLTPKGPRPADRYFTAWTNTCKVQMANLLYEANIVLFAVVRSLPRWANPPMLGKLGKLLLLDYEALTAVGLMECPYCGRHTTCLYGEGTEANPHRCRWCLDRTSPFGASITLTNNGTVRFFCCGEESEIDLDGNILRETHDMAPEALSNDIVPFRKPKPMASVEGKRAPEDMTNDTIPSRATTDMSGMELGRLASKAMSARLYGWHAVLTAMRFVSDANRIKNPYGKAKRLALAWQACSRAFQYEDGRDTAIDVRDQLNAKLDQAIIAYIDLVDQKHQRQLGRTTNRKRQLAISTKAVDEVSRFLDLSDYFDEARVWYEHATKRLSDWRAQLALVADA